MMRLLATCAALSAAAFVAPQAAAADPPSSTSFPFYETQTDVALCGFPIYFTFTGVFTEQDFFDTAGNLVQVHIQSSDVATVVGTGGTGATGHEVVNIHVDINNQTQQSIGVSLHFNGVLIEAGRIVVDANGNVTAVAGKHQLLAGDLGKFCASFT